MPVAGFNFAFGVFCSSLRGTVGCGVGTCVRRFNWSTFASIEGGRGKAVRLVGSDIFVFWDKASARTYTQGFFVSSYVSSLAPCTKYYRISMRRPCIADTLAAKPSGKEDSKGEKCREREIAYSAKIVQSSNQSPTTFPRNTTPSSRALALMRNLAQTGLAAGKRNTHHERAAFTRLLRWLLLAARSS